MQKGFDERSIVTEVLSGNRNAFIKLIKQYEGLVLHIVTPLIGVTADREDISQDVFIKVYERLHTFQFKSKLSTWIGKIAYNTSMNFLQKRKNISLSSLVISENELAFLENAATDLNNPEQLIIKHEDGKEINNAIDSLPAFQKTVLILFYKDDLSIEEINTILDIPINTVKSHLFRARNTLKQLISKP